MSRKRLFQGHTLPLVARLWREWVRPHRRTLAIVLVLIALGALATSAYPLLIKAAFDAFDRRDLEAIRFAPFIVIAVTAIKGFSLYGQSLLTNRVVTRV